MNVRVLETNILHASDVIYWLNGATGTEDDGSDMQRVDREILVEIATAPSDLGFVRRADRLAVWRRPQTPMIDKLATEAQRERPIEIPFLLSGVARDAGGYFNPRSFEILAGNAVGHGCVLYPSPRGVRLGPAGGLVGSLRLEATGQPACWAVLTLEVMTGLGSSMRFRAQADARGEFMLSLTRLPPLPKNVSSYPATLAVDAPADADPDDPADIDDLVEMQLGELDEDDFDDDIELNIVPGEIRRVTSFAKDYLAVQPDS